MSVAPREACVCESESDYNERRSPVDRQYNGDNKNASFILFPWPELRRPIEIGPIERKRDGSVMDRPRYASTEQTLAEMARP